MDEILDLAGRLGKSLREHERFRALRVAESAVLAQPASARLADDLGRLQRETAEAESEGRRLEPARVQELQRVLEAVARDPLLQALRRAQIEFQDALNKVSTRMLAEIAHAKEPS